MFTFINHQKTQIKTAVSYHLTPVRRVLSKLGGEVEKGHPSALLLGLSIPRVLLPLCKTMWRILKTLKTVA